MNHQLQTLNNCHRASIAILMGYYDVWFSQHEHDLAMDSLAEFLIDYGLTAKVYTMIYAEISPSNVVQWLLSQDIPVIAGQQLSLSDNTWHYRVVHGYDDADQSFFIDDPLLGMIRLPYETFDTLAKGQGYLIPVYPIGSADLVESQMKLWKFKIINYPN
jgi:hypothetical protein